MALAEAEIAQPSALDSALEGLLEALRAEADPDAAAIREAIAVEDFARADALAAEWAETAAADARPWRWRVVLAEGDAERAAAADYALRAGPDSPHAPQLAAVLDALGQASAPVESPVTLDDWPVLLEDEGVSARWTAGRRWMRRWPPALRMPFLLQIEALSAPTGLPSEAALLPGDSAAAAEMPIMAPTAASDGHERPDGRRGDPGSLAGRRAGPGPDRPPGGDRRGAATARARVRQAISGRPATPDMIPPRSSLLSPRRRRLWRP